MFANILKVSFVLLETNRLYSFDLDGLKGYFLLQRRDESDIRRKKELGGRAFM